MKKRANSWLFRNVYWDHCSVSRPWCKRVIQDGAAGVDGKRLIEGLLWLRQRTLNDMLDKEGIAVLRILKDRLYGTWAGPTWEFLYDRAIASGRQHGEDAAVAALEWALETHGPHIDAKNRWYKAVLKPSERFRALKETTLRWARTEDAAYPWECRQGEEFLRIEIGDFPIEHLYHVHCSGEVLGVVDDWPATWTRESWL